VNRIGREFIVESDGSPGVSTPEFAGLLRSYEETLSREQPERVVVADDSDSALAAALVAAKLLIPIESRLDASRPASANGQVIAQLAAA
jgi:hypothetical protein